MISEHPFLTMKHEFDKYLVLYCQLSMYHDLIGWQIDYMDWFATLVKLKIGCQNMPYKKLTRSTTRAVAWLKQTKILFVAQPQICKDASWNLFQLDRDREKKINSCFSNLKLKLKLEHNKYKN